MYSRWFNVAVIVLWLTTMGWLFHEKVLPPLLVGEPPSYRTILHAQRSNPPVGWSMSVNGRPLGWALSKTADLPNGLTEIRSCVHFEEIPLQQMTPGWLRGALEVIDRPRNALEMDAHSLLIIDPLGRLSRFESRVWLDPKTALLSLQGTVEGSELELEVRSGDFLYATKAYLPRNALLGDSLSPQTQLPGLRVGQTWTVPAYSLFRPPNDPMEILEATVERIEPINYDGRPEDTLLVVYRNDPGFGIGRDRSPRGKLWVRGDGTVLKQEVTFLNSTMTFVRLSDKESYELDLKSTIN